MHSPSLDCLSGLLVKWRTSALGLVSILGFCGIIDAQGTLNFSNIGGGVDSPVSYNGKLLGAGWSIELILLLPEEPPEEPLPPPPSDSYVFPEFREGFRIAGPAHFLVSGYFIGGVVKIPGIPPGEEVDLVVVVSRNFNQNGFSLYEGQGISAPFPVVLGGLGEPPSLPTSLSELLPFDAGYTWFYGGGFRSCDGPDGALSNEAISHCDGVIAGWVDWDEKVIPELNFDVGMGGVLRLSWLAGSSMRLFGSDSLSRSNGEIVTDVVYEEGYQILTIAPNEPKKFFWLAEPDTTAN